MRVPALPPGLRGLLLDVNAFLFPPACVICRGAMPARRPIPLCRECRTRFVPVHGPTCLLCRTRTRDRAGFMAGRTCRDPAHAPYVAWAAVQMVDPADRLVHALKFHDRPEVGAVMALLISRRLKSERRGSWDLVLPMPLHATRQRARGYNQSAEIGTRLARSLDARFADRILLRARATRPQADLDHAARAGNVEGAFRLARGRDRRRPEQVPVAADTGIPTRSRTDRRAGPVTGRRCLLVDDVATTGHTLVAAIDALGAGAPAATGAAVFALA